MGSVTKVCAETEDTTEQEYITADGCYTYKILDAEKKTAALTKVDKTKLSVTEVDSQNILTIPSKVDDEYTVTELGDNCFAWYMKLDRLIVRQRMQIVIRPVKRTVIRQMIRMVTRPRIKK